MNGVLIRGDWDAQGGAMDAHTEERPWEVTMRSEVSGETRPADTLILDFQPPEL